LHDTGEDCVDDGVDGRVRDEVVGGVDVETLVGGDGRSDVL